MKRTRRRTKSTARGRRDAGQPPRRERSGCGDTGGPDPYFDVVRPLVIELLRSGRGTQPDLLGFDAAVTELEAVSPTLPDGLIDELVFVVLHTEVLRLFEEGWQPRELAHAVDHCFGPAQIRLLRLGMGNHALAHDARACAPADWLAQLTDLAVPLTGRPRSVESWRLTEGLNATTVWRPAFTLLSLLAGMSPLPTRCPIPSDWSRDIVAPSPVETSRPDDLTRIRELLTAADATHHADRTHEEAYRVAAHLAYATLLEDVRATSPLITRMRARTFLIDEPHTGTKADLLEEVCVALGARAVSLIGLGISVVVGRPFDIDLTDALYRSLLRHASTAAAGGTEDDGFRASIQRINEAVPLWREEVHDLFFEEYGSTGLRVLAERDAAADVVFDSLFPEAVHIERTDAG